MSSIIRQHGGGVRRQGLDQRLENKQPSNPLTQERESQIAQDGNASNRSVPKRDRRMSSIIRQHGGAVKRKIIPPIKSKPKDQVFQMPQLRKVQRPSVQTKIKGRSNPFLQMITEEDPSDIEVLQEFDEQDLLEEPLPAIPGPSRILSRPLPADDSNDELVDLALPPSPHQQRLLSPELESSDYEDAEEISSRQFVHERKSSLNEKENEVRQSSNPALVFSRRNQANQQSFQEVLPDSAIEQVTPLPTANFTKSVSGKVLQSPRASNPGGSRIERQQASGMTPIKSSLRSGNKPAGAERSRIPFATDQPHFPERQKRKSDVTLPSLGAVGRMLGESQWRRHTDASKRRLTGSRRYRPSVVGEHQYSRISHSLLLHMAENERRFHEWVAEGDVREVERFLAENPEFNMNCVNYQNISALHVAIRERNEDMVRLLLGQRDIRVSDIVLYTIKSSDLHMLQIVLSCLEHTHPRIEFLPCPDSPEFADDVTPLMLAAGEGKFEMVDFLLERGHRMPNIHHPFCNCAECLANLKKFDRLKYSTMKLNVYRAISNPMYLFQTTNDPIRRAFELTRELQSAARMFPQFYSEYEEMWISLRILSADLIACCRNAQEIELILKEPSGCDSAVKLVYPRLQMAIDLMQKEFVAHPFTQAVLEDAWIGKLSEWKVQTPFQQTIAIIPRIFMLPVMAAMACCMPNSKMLERWNYPVNKLVSAFAGYILFLVALLFQSTEDKRNQKRGPPNTGWESVIVLFVLGFFWSSVRLCFTLGPKRFFSLLWNWYDCVMELLFLLTFIFWIAAWADVLAHDDVDLPRKYWNAYDPTLISEGLLSIATIMAYCRLYMPMSLNYYLGPLQISIGKMTLDLFRFVFVYVLLILAWSVALCHFYQPYYGMVQTDYSSNTNTTQVPSFVNFSSALKTFFWAIFGLAAIESADVIIANTPDEPTNTHNFTEGVGYFVFAVFQFIAVIVILNMLVACMANTFTKVIDNVTIEWVFGRTKIYLAYMYQSTLPPPFNLLPTIATFNNAVTWLSLMGNSGKKQAACSFSHCCYIVIAFMSLLQGRPKDYGVEDHIGGDFQHLMTQVVQRYLRTKEDSAETEHADAKPDSHRSRISRVKNVMDESSYVGSLSYRNEVYSNADSNT